MRSAVRLTATERTRVTDRTQVTALNRALLAQGIGDPAPDEGLRVSYDHETGVLAVEADRDVTQILETWALDPPPSAREQLMAELAEAATVEELRTALVVAVDAGVLTRGAGVA